MHAFMIYILWYFHNVVGFYFKQQIFKVASLLFVNKLYLPISLFENVSFDQIGFRVLS
ncbi:hypothetical protein Nmel_008390 [Mimus melanotis]